jgi:hypothetical protein
VLRSTAWPVMLAPASYALASLIFAGSFGVRRQRDT